MPEEKWQNTEKNGEKAENKPDVAPVKQKKETEAQKQAFELYYSMGAKRSLAAVAVSCGKTTRTIGEWSRIFKWQDRIVQREIEETQEKGSVANAVIDAKAVKIRIKNIQDFERLVKLDLLLLGDPTERVQQENKENVELSEEDRRAIFAVADSIKAEMKALRG